MFVEDLETADDMLQTFLVKSVAKFTNCTKDILTLDTENKQFNCTLDVQEQVIISDIMVVNWLDWHINDIRQMNLTLNDNDLMVA